MCLAVLICRSWKKCRSGPPSTIEHIALAGLQREQITEAFLQVRQVRPPGGSLASVVSSSAASRRQPNNNNICELISESHKEFCQVIDEPPYTVESKFCLMPSMSSNQQGSKLLGNVPNILDRLLDLDRQTTTLEMSQPRS